MCVCIRVLVFFFAEVMCVVGQIGPSSQRNLLLLLIVGWVVGIGGPVADVPCYARSMRDDTDDSRWTSPKFKAGVIRMSARTWRRRNRRQERQWWTAAPTGATESDQTGSEVARVGLATRSTPLALWPTGSLTARQSRPLGVLMSAPLSDRPQDVDGSIARCALGVPSAVGHSATRPHALLRGPRDEGRALFVGTDAWIRSGAQRAYRAGATRGVGRPRPQQNGGESWAQQRSGRPRPHQVGGQQQTRCEWCSQVKPPSQGAPARAGGNMGEGADCVRPPAWPLQAPVYELLSAPVVAWTSAQIWLKRHWAFLRWRMARRGRILGSGRLLRTAPCDHSMAPCPHPERTRRTSSCYVVVHSMCGCKRPELSIRLPPLSRGFACSQTKSPAGVSSSMQFGTPASCKDWQPRRPEATSLASWQANRCTSPASKRGRGWGTVDAPLRRGWSPGHARRCSPGTLDYSSGKWYCFDCWDAYQRSRQAPAGRARR